MTCCIIHIITTKYTINSFLTDKPGSEGMGLSLNAPTADPPPRFPFAAAGLTANDECALNYNTERNNDKITTNTKSYTFN